MRCLRLASSSSRVFSGAGRCSLRLRQRAWLSSLPDLSHDKDEHHFDEVEINGVLRAEEERLASYNGVQVLSSTGVRAVEFFRPDRGNHFTTSVMENLTKKIEDFENNWVANAIFLGSQSLFFFSRGVHEKDFLDDENEGQKLDKAIQKCSSRIYDFPDHMISLYGGFITGTPFGMLMGSHYRLGTPSLLLCLDELTRGQLPLGGLALQFARYSTISPVVLKYLAFSGANLHSNELYELGVLTHLTDHKPHRGLQYGDTILINDIKAIQAPHGEPEYLKDMIDDMDINADIDVHSHEAWDQFLTTPVTVPDDDPLEPTNIKLIFEEMEPCFKEGMSLEESVSSILAIRKDGKPGEQNEWVENSLRHLVRCCPLALKCWFKLVDESQRRIDIYRDMVNDADANSAEDCQHYLKRAHADMLEMEVGINDALRQHQRDGKFVVQNVVEKEKFDLSFYEDDAAEDIDLLERKTLKELNKEREEKEAAELQAEKILNDELQSFQAALERVTDEQVRTIFSSATAGKK